MLFYPNTLRKIAKWSIKFITSYEFDGPFSDLSQSIWVEQHKELQLLLGRDYWYENKNPHLRAVHGAVNLKEMNTNEFLSVARKLEEQMEGSPI